MKSFADWTTDLAAANNATKRADALPMTWEEWEEEGTVRVDVLGRPMAYCRVCGEDTEVYCEPEHFDPDYHYCGGSPRCCP